ncbi:MAG: hypothetical protein IJB96_10800 [Lachnospira sp.]|nr:hypothetical protein [Lachnospira sp.]
MEKNNDSVIVKIVSVAGILAALALVFIIILRGDLFSGVVSAINSTKAGYESATIYDVCYYKAWNVIYGGVYSIALFATVIAPVALMLRFNGAASLARYAAIADIVLAVIVIIAKILGNNGVMHKITAKIYLDEIGVVTAYGDFMGVFPIVAAIIVLVLSVIVLMIIHSSKLDKVKLYNNEGPREIVRMIIPVLYGSVFLETIRPLVISAVCHRIGGMSDTVNTFVTDYFFADVWGFNVPYVWFVIVVALAVIVANRYFKKLKDNVIPIVMGVMTALYIIRCIIYIANPPRLFGYLTLDDAICDATELAYPIYMLLIVTDVLVVMMLAYWCTKKELAKRTLLIVLVSHMIITLIAIATVGIGMAIVYGISLVANILILISSFYMAYIRGRHH